MKNKDIIVIFNQRGLTFDMHEVNSKAYWNDTLLEEFTSKPYHALFYFGFEERNPDMSVSLSFLHSVCQHFINVISHDPDIEITKTVKVPDTSVFLDMLRSVPYAVGAEHISADWFADLWTELSQVFEQELSEWTGTVTSFLNTHNSKLNVADRVFFHLVENKSGEYPFAFLATYSTEAGEQKKAVHVPLKHALLEYKDRQDLLLKLLSAVSRAADRSDFISELVESGELFSPLQLEAGEAYTFLKEIPLYEECGIMCRMPDWWKKRNSSLKLSVSIGGNEPAMMGLDALLSCMPSLLLDGEEISREEIQTLMSQAAGLAFLKGKWIEVDHEKLKAVLEAYEKVSSMGEVTLSEAMRMELGVSQGAAHDFGDGLEITNGQWLKHLRNRLIEPSLLNNLETSSGFKASLRHYQQEGFNWLALMKDMGFGALLADDMGLGKTIQILALLEYLRTNSGFCGLLIIPASLIGNWQKEIARFAPEIKYSVLHSKNTELDDKTDLFITTYGMALRLDRLRSRKWDLVILDEAQAIKNPAAGQTKAIKQLKASFKIAMTGTPIENKLGDLWSLFDFLNSGLLGTSKEFSNFAKNMKESGHYSKLRQVVSPFILRRLKTDKEVISDLPDKIEIKAYTALTNKQVLLYHELVRELEHKLVTAEGIERKGIVLAAIMKFKQICNHSDQYLGQSAYKITGSGKFEKLQEICETIYEKRERVLVFTQFKEMTGPLAEFLSVLFRRNGLVLHGGTTVKKRGEMVEKFNGEEYVPVARKKENAQKALTKLRKKMPDLQPVAISGNKIAKTWWGYAWNRNLESYADYSNRISRGRSYVKNGFVLDLHIDTGKVTAIVAGSGRDPYHVEIAINALSKEKWNKITEVCGRSIAGIDQLVQGKFPKELETLFTQKGQGLFSSPKEIKFSCDCPDWAYMCKHVAAALYGIGARLDEEPVLFFKLRNIEIEALIRKSIEEKMESMLRNAGKKTQRVMEDADVGDLFGICSFTRNDQN